MGKPDLSLLTPFLAGERVTIQRTVKGQNVLMEVEVLEPCALGPNRMVLTARPRVWGPSHYADGRVARQAKTIERLSNERQRVLEIATEHGFTEIVGLLTGEGTDSANAQEQAGSAEASASAPEQDLQS